MMDMPGDSVSGSVKMKSKYIFNNSPVTNYQYDGDHWVDFDTDAGHYHIPVLTWINAKYTGLVKSV